MLTLRAGSECSGFKEGPCICRATPEWHFPGRAVGDSDEVNRRVGWGFLNVNSPSGSPTVVSGIERENGSRGSQHPHYMIASVGDIDRPTAINRHPHGTSQTRCGKLCQTLFIS